MSQPDANPPADFTVSLPDSWRSSIEQRGGPAERIEVIEDSLRCYAYGWLSCVPVIGVAWLYPAVRRFAQARRRQAEWNPARGYLAAGLALASVGWMVNVWSWLIALVAVAIVDAQNADGLNLGQLLIAATLFNSPFVIVGLLLATATGWSVPLFSRRFWWWVVGIAAAFCFANLWWMLSKLAEHGQVEAKWVPFLHISAWGVWLMAGFLTLALRKAGRWAWLVWFAVLVALTLPFLVM